MRKASRANGYVDPIFPPLFVYSLVVVLETGFFAGPSISWTENA